MSALDALGNVTNDEAISKVNRSPESKSIDTDSVSSYVVIADQPIEQADKLVRLGSALLSAHL